MTCKKHTCVKLAISAQVSSLMRRLQFSRQVSRKSREAMPANGLEVRPLHPLHARYSNWRRPVNIAGKPWPLPCKGQQLKQFAVQWGIVVKDFGLIQPATARYLGRSDARMGPQTAPS